MRKFLLLIFITTFAIVGCKDDAKNFTSDGLPPPGPLVNGLDLTELAIYQGTKITLMSNGVASEPGRASVIADKEAMLRFSVTAQADWEPRTVYGRVDIEYADGSSWGVRLEKQIDGSSAAGNLATSINLEIPGERIKPGMQYTASLRELDESTTGPGNANASLWPADAMATLDMQDVNGDLEIVIIPVEYNADGSGRLPETGAAQLDLIEDYFISNYPIAGVELIVDEPLPWPSNVGAMGGGWEPLLSAISQLRSTRGIESHQYIYGLVAPAATFGAFCNAGCVTGLSTLAMSPGDAFARASIGVGYEGSVSVETMVHEVGHAHGRDHSPCGTSGDPAYPHAGAAIGEQGYFLAKQTLYDPSNTKDFMSYCQPTWVSDWTYQKLTDRVVAVNQLADYYPAPDFDTHWSSIIVGADGSNPVVGATFELAMPPSGETMTIELLDSDGNLVEQVTGYYTPMDHLDRGFLLFQTPPEHIVYVTLDHVKWVPLREPS